MPIVRFTPKREDVPVGAQNVRYSETSKVWMWDEYVGLCLEDRERNFHDDSDFYMIVWDPEKQEPREVEYATTRGWTYPAYGSRADATPEVRAAYEEWCRKDARRRRLERLLAIRQRDQQHRRETGLTYQQWRKLREAVGDTVFEQVFFPLLRSYHANRLRSPFRKSLAEQTWRWLRGESEYRTPLSPRQMQYL